MTTWPQVPVNVTVRDNLCFGCGQKNPIGLKLEFKKDGKTARAEFTPSQSFQGWPGFVHGGILTCLLDEAMGWAAILEGINSVTAKMEVRLRRMAPVNEPLVITGWVTRKTRKLVETATAIHSKDGTLVAEAKGTAFIVDSQPDTK